MRTFILLVLTAVGLLQPGCGNPPVSEDGGDRGTNASGAAGVAGSGLTAGLGGTNAAGASALGGSAGTAAASGSGGTSGVAGSSGGSIGLGGSGVGGMPSAGSGGSSGSAAGGNAGAPIAGMAGSTIAGAGGRGGAGGRSAGGAAGNTSGGQGGAGSFDPCPATGACRILPLGDSITDGLTVQGGYRIELFHLALQANKTITYLGSLMNGPTMVDSMPFPRSHEGHSGWTIAQIDGIVPTPALAATVNPHIILLHIGTNDMLGGSAGAPDRLGTLIDQILTAAPNALLVVSNIIPLPGGASAVMTYNAAVPGVVTMRKNAGKHILFVDQFTGFPTSELQDGVHPNTAGYARMARAWFAVISTYLH